MEGRLEVAEERVSRMESEMEAKNAKLDDVMKTKETLLTEKVFTTNKRHTLIHNSDNNSS